MAVGQHERSSRGGAESYDDSSFSNPGCFISSTLYTKYLKQWSLNTIVKSPALSVLQLTRDDV